MIDDIAWGDAGVVNATGPTTTAPPDATGGKGSFLDGLLDTLTNGVNAYAQAEISKNIGGTLGQGLATVDEYGNVTYRGTPARPAPIQIAPAYAAKSFFTSTAGLLTIGGVALGVILLVALKK
jgi:hypothetical protein